MGTSEVGKLEAKMIDITRNAKVLREVTFTPDPDDDIHLRQEFGHIKPAVPCPVGRSPPGALPKVARVLGKDLVIQVSGGTIGYPYGPKVRAVAARQVLEAIAKGILLDECAREHKELKAALEKWGLREAHLTTCPSRKSSRPRKRKLLPCRLFAVMLTSRKEELPY